MAFSEVENPTTPKRPPLSEPFRSFLGDNDMMAYLSMMAVRFLELYSVIEANRLAIFTLRPNC